MFFFKHVKDMNKKTWRYFEDYLRCGTWKWLLWEITVISRTYPLSRCLKISRRMSSRCAREVTKIERNLRAPHWLSISHLHPQGQILILMIFYPMSSLPCLSRNSRYSWGRIILLVTKLALHLQQKYLLKGNSKEHMKGHPVREVK